MSKFTKGPWSISKPLLNEGYVCVLPLADKGEGSGRNYVARVNTTIEDGDTKANAALIAAAPELYETLKMAEATLEVVGAHFNLSQTLATIKAALANARGES
jgi:hypothetical protein